MTLWFVYVPQVQFLDSWLWYRPVGEVYKLGFVISLERIPRFAIRAEVIGVIFSPELPCKLVLLAGRQHKRTVGV